MTTNTSGYVNYFATNAELFYLEDDDTRGIMVAK
jgi:hypothetical protein